MNSLLKYSYPGWGVVLLAIALFLAVFVLAFVLAVVLLWIGCTRPRAPRLHELPS